MEHFLLDWPIEVHIIAIFESQNLCEVVLNDMILGNVQHFVTLDRNVRKLSFKKLKYDRLFIQARVEDSSE